MSKAFDTINLHTLIRKLLQTTIPDTIIKFIANYIKGSKSFTTYRNHTSIQRQFKTGVPQGGVFSPTLFNINTADLPTLRAPVQVMVYADDITITSTHTSTNKQHCTKHGNVPKGSGSYLGPKAHIQHTPRLKIQTKTQHPSHPFHKYTTYFNTQKHYL